MYIEMKIIIGIYIIFLGNRKNSVNLNKEINIIIFLAVYCEIAFLEVAANHYSHMVCLRW